MRTLLITIFFCLEFLGHSFGQVSFDYLFGNSGNDYGTSVIQTFDGGYLIGGAIYNGNDSDIFIVRTNGTGDTLWTRVFSAPGNETVASLIQTADSGFAILADGSDSLYSHNILLLRIDSIGTLLWANKYGDGEDLPKAFVKTFDQGFCIAGSSNLLPGFSSRALIIKTNADGDTLWTKKYFNGLLYSAGFDITQTLDSGFVILGALYQLDVSKPILIKLNALGEPINNLTFDYTIDGKFIHAFTETGDGSFIITGYDYETPVNNGFFAKVDSSFQLSWLKLITPFNIQPSNVLVDKNGNYVFQGRYSSSVNFNNFIITTDTSGIILSAKSYPYAYCDYNNSFQQTADSGFVSCGTLFDSLGFNSRVAVIKINTHFDNCDIQPISIGDTMISAISSSVLLDTLSGMAVAPATFLVSRGCSQYNYCPVTLIHPITNNQKYISVYPNPSQNKFTFKVTETVKEIDIINLLGELILTVSKTEIDLAPFPPGIYFYAIKTESGNLINGKLIKD